MLGLLRTAVEHTSGPFSIRWPRDTVPDDVPAMAEVQAVPFGTWEVLRRGHGLAILAVGTMVLPALQAAQQLARDGVHATVVNCRYLKPYDRQILEELVRTHAAFVTVEEGTVVNGFGAFMAREIAQLAEGRGVALETLGIPDHFVEHGHRDALLADMGLDAQGIAAVSRALAERAGVKGPSRETA
jgi:1-deoxy-D-xylulose-5-phosphate synthase